MRLDFIGNRGDRLSLTGNKNFYLTNVDAQTEASAALSTVITGGVDGSTVTGEQADPRTIVLDLRINPAVDVEEAKREILRVVKLKQYGTLEWEQRGRIVTISGIIEEIAMPRWKNAVVMQISLYCEQPFWEDVDIVVREINEYIGLHFFTDTEGDMLYFPAEGIPFGMYDASRSRTFVNEGDVSCGLTITIRALSTVTNPVIFDTDANFFGVGYGTGTKKVTMNEGDVLVITTHKGNKTVKLNGVSLFDKIKPLSKWLQLQTGENQFAVSSDDSDTGNMIFNLEYKQRYV